MRVGNSPIYYVQGQESQLEKFSSYLKSKEKDAFILLQERKFLKDSEQTPAIRVALREIKDFAFSFKRNNEIFWRYLTSKESEFNQEIKSIEEHEFVQAKPKPFDKEERKIGEKMIKDIDIKEIEKIRKDQEKLEEKEEEKEIEEEIEEKEEYITLPIPEKTKEEKKVDEKEELIKEKKKEKPERQKPKAKPEKTSKKKPAVGQAQNDKFFDKIKEFLSKETIEIVNIESFNKNEILLRIKYEGTEKLLVAYNKKKVLDTDIINANKKASQLNLKYVILSMGEPSKKLSSLIESAQNLEKIEKIEK